MTTLYLNKQANLVHRSLEMQTMLTIHDDRAGLFKGDEHCLDCCFDFGPDRINILLAVIANLFAFCFVGAIQIRDVFTTSGTSAFGPTDNLQLHMKVQEIVQEIFKVSLKYNDLYGGQDTTVPISNDLSQEKYAHALQIAFCIDDAKLWNHVKAAIAYPPLAETSCKKTINYFQAIRDSVNAKPDTIRLCVEAIYDYSKADSEWIARIRNRYVSPASYLFRVALVLQCHQPQIALQPYEQTIENAFALPPPVEKIVETAADRLQRVVQPQSSTTSMAGRNISESVYTPTTVIELF
jgi:hypothetical protein